MRTPSTSKLGSRDRIWWFNLPSRLTCPGKSGPCSRHCYAARLEAWRPSVRERYQQNYVLSQQEDFVERMRDSIHQHHAQVIRIHSAGDFYDENYARKWLEIIQSARGVSYYCYSRSWRVLPLLPFLSRWQSCPTCVPGFPPNTKPVLLRRCLQERDWPG